MVLRLSWMALLGFYFFFMGISPVHARSHVSLKVIVRQSGVVRLKVSLKNRRANAEWKVSLSRSQDPSQMNFIKRAKSRANEVRLKDNPPTPGTYYYRVRVRDTNDRRKNLWSKIVSAETQIPDTTPSDPYYPFDPPSDPPAIDPHFELPAGMTDCESEFESAIIVGTNQQRQDNGFSALEINLYLSYAARIHSKNMALAQSMTHDGWFDEIWNDAGLHMSHLGQNIAAGFSDPNVLVNAWMASPGHRVNMLKPDYSMIGVSCVKDALGYRWWTQNFGG